MMGQASSGLGYGNTGSVGGLGTTPLAATKDTSSARLAGRLDVLDNLAGDLENMAATIEERLTGPVPEGQAGGQAAPAGFGLLNGATARLDSSNARLDRVRAILSRVLNEL